ncbi:MAG: FG-GAP-like repeat-containing protein [Planctomycetota bacterium]|jgi:hypothetical protein
MSGRYRNVIAPAVVLLAMVLPSAAQQRQPQALDGQILDSLRLTRYSAQRLEVPAEPAGEFEVNVDLDGIPHTLRLRPHSLRADNFRLLVQGADGELREIAAPPPRTYRGEVIGLETGEVAASVIDGQLTATLLMDDGTKWQTEPLSQDAAQADRAMHVVYHDDDVVPLAEGFCGTDAFQNDGAPPPGSEQIGGPPLISQVEIAFDADFEFYSGVHGYSVTNVSNDIDTLLNSVDMIYKTHVGVTYLFTTLIIRQAEPDPYFSSVGGQLLDDFRTQWNTAHAGIPRDIAHLMTGKDVDGGSLLGLAAGIGTMCDRANNYAWSSAYTGNYALRVALTAHEIGHNWGGIHCEFEDDCAIMCSGGADCPRDHFGSGTISRVTIVRDSAPCATVVTPTPFFGTPYIIWRHLVTGHNESWLLEGGVVEWSITLPALINTNFFVAGTGDFDGDGFWDILWRNGVNGYNWMWLYNGLVVSDQIQIPLVKAPNWFVAGVGDFNGDGFDDILWRHRANWKSKIWFMNGGTVQAGSGLIALQSTDLEIVGVGDFNADGMDDILWRNRKTGENSIWFMNGLTALPASGDLPRVANLAWTVVGVGDFDFDGNDDILWRNIANGKNSIWFMNGLVLQGGSGPIQAVTNQDWQIIGVAQMSEDFMADILWRNFSNGKNVVWVMNGNTIQAGSGALPPLTDMDWVIQGIGN